MIAELIGEEWRDVSAYEGLYQVSNLGRCRKLILGELGDEKRYKIMSAKKKDKDGYTIIMVTTNRQTKYLRLHRLVASAFIPNLDDKPYVDHINTIKDDNRASNLRWVTAAENSNNPLTLERNRVSHIGKPQSLESRMKKRASSKTKAVIQFDLSGNKVAEFEAVSDASRATGASIGSIANCCRGRNKTAGGFVWRYAR